MDIESRGHIRFDRVEEFAELHGAMAGRALAERAVAAVQASGDELISRALSTAEMARLAGLLRKLLLAVKP